MEGLAALHALDVRSEKLMRRRLQISVIMVVALSLQGCGMIGSMLFDPVVKAAYIIPEQVTPIEVLKKSPNEFSGQYVAVSGVATKVDSEIIEIDGYLVIHRNGNPSFENVKDGDRVAVRGKFSSNRFSTGRPEIRYVVSDKYRPHYDEANRVGTRTEPAPPTPPDMRI